MRSLRLKIKELGSLGDCEDLDSLIDFVTGIKDEALSIMDDVESIVNEAEDAIENINKSTYIELDDIEISIKDASESLY